MDIKTEDLKRLYDAGYYRGVTSGYPEEGYRESHPDWTPWLDVVGRVRPGGGVWIDLGCAYGYLPREARLRGHLAVGLDVSDFAVHQEPNFAGFLLQSDVSRAPMASGCADIVSAFDVLEHVPNPGEALTEIVRLLAPEGLLIGATPDPIYFDRIEETHFSERPPSFWLALMEDLGLHVCFRFSGEAFNFQFIACRKEALIRDRIGLLQHDYFSEDEDFLSVSQGVQAVPRTGWGPLKDKSRAMVGDHASIYIRNSASTPVALKIGINLESTPDFSTLRIRLNSQVLDEIHLHPDSAKWESVFSDLVIPSGGHHLFFDVFPGGPRVTVSDIQISSRPADRMQLCEQMPFDLYQRYRLAAQIGQSIQPASILDVGGVLGDRDGHLAASEDFFLLEGCMARVATTDLRHCDHPSHTPSAAGRLPFPDKSFDLVLSLDVLEHVPPSERLAFLRELDRVSSQWILIGAPFASENVDRVETELLGVLGLPFLNEHAELGLPPASIVKEGLMHDSERWMKAIPNGFLPRWKELQLLTQLFFSLRRVEISRTFNQLCNQNCYQYDQAAPSYRSLYLIGKRPPSDELVEKLEGLLAARAHPEERSCQELMAEDPRFSQLVFRAFQVLQSFDRAIGDTQFLANQRQKHIALLLKEIETIKNTPLIDIARERFRNRKK